MSTAHRPTWAPAQARSVGSGSRQISVKDVNAFTKLKFRQPGQGTTTEINRRDLKLELERAEQAAKNKRKGIATGATNIDEEQGVPAPSLVPGAPVGATQGVEDEQAAKRRKLIEDAAELDKDDSDEEDGGDEVGVGDKVHTNGFGKGKGKAADGTDTAEGQDGQAKDAEDYGEEEDTDEEEDEDEEDETAELLRELEKIKRERAEEKERQDRERATSAAISAEEAAATGNPLLNLQAALSGNKSYDSPGGYSSSASSSSFQIKKRWDDDVIFKNQATKSDAPKREFVNDLIRTQFHRRFLQKYIA
ncbi:MAG: hypothetical protein CYPHOPRED_003470 [Cyphobasidiales sp. Tagirdzhanova-0007]|nr:MAG: hypothetical protein CYPHOPRED_003470 [Cyphobasidiales sp. Tagirdzhanova-0007]